MQQGEVALPTASSVLWECRRMLTVLSCSFVCVENQVPLTSAAATNANLCAACCVYTGASSSWRPGQRP
jgi:hypothetical protein